MIHNIAFWRLAVVGLPATLAFFHLQGVTDDLISVATDAYWTLASLAAGILCLIAARRQNGSDALAWHCFAAACLSWFVGMVVWSWLELIEHRSVPFPAASDFFFLAFAPLFGAGIWFLQTTKDSIETGYVRRILDLGLFATASALFVIFMLYPHLGSHDNRSLFVIVAISYPVLYLTVALLAVHRAASFIWGPKGFTFAMMLIGLLIHTAADAIYAFSLLEGTYEVGKLLDFSWLLGFAFIALGALETIASPTDRESAFGRMMASRLQLLRDVQPSTFLVFAAIVMVGFRLHTGSVDLDVLPVVFPLVLIFFTLSTYKEIRDRRAERRLLEAAQSYARRLAANEQKLRDIAVTTFDRIWATDSAHRFTSIIGEASTHLPPGPHHALGKTRWEVCGGDPEHDEHWRRHRANLDLHRPFRDFEYSIASNTEQMQSWNVSGKPVFDDQDRFVGYIGSAKDITDKKKLERDAEASRHRLEEIISIAPVGVIVVDRDMTIQLFNRTAQQIFGYGPDEILDKPMEILIPRSSRQAHRTAVANFRNSDERHILMGARQQISGRRKDGSTFPVSASVSRNDTEDAAFYTVILQDMTVQNTAEAARLQALEDAEKANKIKSEFLANMSHELRTPLNSILGFADMIANQYIGPIGNEAYLKYAEDIAFSGRHLLDLVNDILDIERIETGKFPLDIRPTDLAGVLDECARLFEGRTDGAGIALAFDLADGARTVVADRRALLQILTNLISNAIKFTSETDTVKVAAHRTGPNIVIDVADNGVGIPPEKLATVFEPFARHESDPHKAQEGVGLGLAICRGLAELHGGRLDIHSVASAGTTVSVTLPATIADAKDTVPDAPRPSAGRCLNRK